MVELLDGLIDKWLNCWNCRGLSVKCLGRRAGNQVAGYMVQVE
jgi:hypothetical protein